MKQLLAVILMCAVPLSTRAQVIDNFNTHTEYLASDELGGRETGSKHICFAAEYKAGQFKSIGLQQNAEQSYYQQFPIPGQSEIKANFTGINPAASVTKLSAIGTSMGIVFGAAFGFAMGDVGNGVAIGIVLGAGIGAAIDFVTKHKSEDGNSNHKNEGKDS